MKRNWIAVAVASTLLAGIALAQNQKPAGDAKPQAPITSTKDKVSYGIGRNIGENFKRQGLDVNPELLARGIADALAGRDSAVTEEELQAAFAAFQQEMQARQADLAKKEAEKNAKEGAAFLAANKKKEGVKTLPSGLQYKVLKSGDGPSPKASDTVVTNYRGTLIDGTEFDSSYKRGEPAEFPVNAVIKGWTEALQLMKVGDKWQLFVPAELAYGDQARGNVIGPNSVLIFEIELLGIQ